MRKYRRKRVRPTAKKCQSHDVISGNLPSECGLNHCSTAHHKICEQQPDFIQEQWEKVEMGKYAYGTEGESWREGGHAQRCPRNLDILNVDGRLKGIYCQVLKAVYFIFTNMSNFKSQNFWSRNILNTHGCSSIKVEQETGGSGTLHKSKYGLQMWKCSNLECL